MEIEIIYQKYFHDVFLYMRALSGNESLAEEITQETFVKALKNINQFDGKKDIRAWLFTIAKNSYYRYCKRNRIFVEEDFMKTMADTRPDILDHMIEKETVQMIQYNAELLTSPYKEIFYLRIYGNLSFEQIGNHYKKSAGWARVTYHRARRMLQKKIIQED